MLGFERMRGDERQPGTQVVIYKGLDMEVVNKNAKQIQQMYDVAVKEGRLQKGDTRSGKVMQPIRSTRGNVIISSGRFNRCGHSNPNQPGGQKVGLRMLKFLKTIPGGENASIDRMMNETATRETFRIKGETMITVHDYQTGRKFQDALSYSFYPIDLHTKDGVVPKHLKRGSSHHPTWSADPERLEEHPG